MARSKSLSQFARRMAIRAKQIEKGTERTVRQAAVAADTAIVLATPVQTGRAKGNWNASIGTADTSVSDDTDKSGQSTMARNEAMINTWKLKQKEIFIANGLPYILPLDDGSSSQAAEGMTNSGIDAARRVIKNAKLLG